MHAPEIFIAYAPRGAGPHCAVAYLAAGRDVYGWYTGPRPDADIASRCFLLEGYYSDRETRYESVDLADLHSAWSLDEARRHELARMQEAFAREWLFYRDDAHAAAEQRAYEEAELAAGGALNVRFERLGKFSRLQPNWTYYTPHFEHSVLRHLAKRWPLEFRPDYEPAASA
ncbi:MAG: hypothetical protein OEO84_06350 [Betaproteobacteria bacterium]|nr:hypothetical protein [Betaproteobacteria bacterium]